MRVGVLDLLTDSPPQGWVSQLYGRYFRKQFMSIMPQVVAVWCRQLGHRVTYATYYGQQEPLSLLPDDLDVAFIAAYTQASGLAYALSTLLRQRGVLTVIGGPHAKSFPTDCLRFFDIAVKDCDKSLIDSILHGDVDPPAIVSTNRGLTDLPSVEERMPEIIASAFHNGRPLPTSVVPMLSSIGCPYTCDFCVDWNSKYVSLPRGRLKGDLDYLSKHWPRVVIGYHDPNFAVRFDETMNVIETLPAGQRNPYIMESSLSILKGTRLPRLTATNCAYVAPGIESWMDYSNKAGVVGKSGQAKVDQVVAHLKEISSHVPGIQTNLLFGGDLDRGEEPVDLTDDFMTRTPDVWPTVNIPTPFGGTPMHDRLHREGRVLKEMPFAFYYNPYLAITLEHYDAQTYYGHLIRMHETMTSNAMLWRRIRSGGSRIVRLIHVLRTLETRKEVGAFRFLREQLAEDPQLRAFHSGRSAALPEMYHRLFDARLGRYACLVSRKDRMPVFDVPSEPRAKLALRA